MHPAFLSLHFRNVWAVFATTIGSEVASSCTGMCQDDKTTLRAMQISVATFGASLRVCLSFLRWFTAVASMARIVLFAIVGEHLEETCKAVQESSAIHWTAMGGQYFCAFCWPCCDASEILAHRYVHRCTFASHVCGGLPRCGAWCDGG